MFWRILKKDLKRKKAMNAILFVFIILCSLFLGSSISNLDMTTNALNKFSELSGTTDYYLMSTNEINAEDWLSNSKSITDYEHLKFLSVEKNKITLDGKIFDGGNSEPRLTVPSKKYNFVFDENDTLISEVSDGGCCISTTLARKNDAKIGDTLDITIGNVSKTLTIVHISKDYAFGSDFFLINRVLIGENNYKDFYAEAEKESAISSVWTVNVNNINEFINEKNHQEFSFMYETSSEQTSSVYYMEKITSVVMIIMSIVLIVISFTLLRFTIHTTIEDDYREIGVMKAIGIKGSGIRHLYTVKYFAISLVGAGLGAILSIPFTDMLTESLRKNIILQAKNRISFITFLCSALVIAITMLFCRLATGKLGKMTAIQAVREGATGERFKRKGLLHLKGKKRGSIPFFMACNDLISSLNSYVIIFISLTAVLQMIILPYNAYTTLKSGENMMPYFIQESADYYVEMPKAAIDIISKDRDYEALVNYVQNLEDICVEQGLDLKTNLGIPFSAQVYKNDKYDQILIQSWKQTNGKPINIPYLEGTPPLLENEIAVSEVSLEKLNVTLGDKVHMAFGEDTKEYIITASFESMSSGGESIIFSPEIHPDLSYCSPFGYIQFNFANREDAVKNFEKLKQILPELKFYTANETVNLLIGDVVVILKQVINMMVALGLIITCLVILLIGSTLLSKDKGSISLLKSIGFSNYSLRLWQTARIMITAIVASIFGVGLSFLLNSLVTKLTFGLMGASNVPTNINFAYVFGIYPALFILTAVGVSWLVSGGVKKVDIRSVGNLE